MVSAHGGTCLDGSGRRRCSVFGTETVTVHGGGACLGGDGILTATALMSRCTAVLSRKYQGSRGSITVTAVNIAVIAVISWYRAIITVTEVIMKKVYHGNRGYLATIAAISLYFYSVIRSLVEFVA